ncbi:MAG TPA: hypothetical protein VD971_14010 [Phycisphaerales bacterium]|nr:hypothetical protein [Phycisphaerales bacterium]
MRRPGWENAEHCATLRTRACQLARTRWADALEVARGIEIPWYRAQALAGVAESAPEERVDDVLTRACSAAAEGNDAYQRVAVLAWVIEAAAARGRIEYAKRVLADALAKSAGVTPLRSRATTLELLLRAAVGLGERDARVVAVALLDAAAELRAHSGKRWRKWGASYLNRTACLLAPYPALALSLLEACLGEERAKAVFTRHTAARVHNR